MNPLLLLLTGAALALPQFPGAVQDHIGVPCEPLCTLCHQGTPSSGTATTDFVLALQDRGFATSDATLQSALDALAADDVDSDDDGVGDVEELVGGEDPNPGGLVFCDLLTPSYGCLSTAGRAPGAGEALLGFLALLGLAWLRRSSGR